jgi:hypothetical protein
MFRFTIREVLWLTVVVAMALGWWIDHRRVAIRNDSLWSHMLRKDGALTEIEFAIQNHFDGENKSIEKIAKILDEEDKASWKPPTPLLRDGRSN